MKGLRFHDTPMQDNSGVPQAPGPLPAQLGPLHNFAATVQFQGLGCVLCATVPPGPNVDIAFLDEIYEFMGTLAPDATVRTVGATGRDVTCVIVSQAKLKRNQVAFAFTSAAGLVMQFGVRPWPKKGRSECIVDCVQHALSGGRSISNVAVQPQDTSFRAAYEEAKVVAAEDGVEAAMLRLEAHAGDKHPLLKQRQIMDELSSIAKRARFEKRLPRTASYI